MNNEDLQKLKAAAEGCDGWTWPDRRRDENGTHHFGKRTEDGEFHDMGTIDAWTYTSDYADDLRVLKFIRQAQPKDILSLIAEVEQARAANSWMPIETAPEDGAVVLTARQVRHGRGYAIEGMTKNSAGWWVTADGGRPSQPTHWQPLPAAPQ